MKNVVYLHVEINLNLNNYTRINMKKLLLLLAITSIATSCINEDFESMKLDLENLDPFVEKTAPIKDGYTTIIKADGAIICETNETYNYLFPKGSIDTIEYTPTKKDVLYGSWSQTKYTASFEDTRNGDNDYNDFICYLTMENSTKKSSKDNNKDVVTDIYIQPIAYGSGTVLQFGITLPNGQDTIISNNIQEDFFPGTSGYVNTVKTNAIYQTNTVNQIKKLTYTQAGNSSTLNKFYPFIINQQGEKLYLAINFTTSGNNNYTEIIGIAGYPLGIATKGIFDYPAEKINISSCYSNFNSWVTGSSTQIGSVTGVSNNVFIISNSGNGSSGLIIHSNPKNLF